MQYFHRINPEITADGAKRCIASARADLERLRPKARAARERDIQLMEMDLAQLEAPRA